MPEPRKGDWLQTASGLRFWPLDPRPDEVRLDDVAHALSHLCRFGGHVSAFYSVAQHSVHVSEMCDEDHALAGLIHDAAEAYIVDVPRPIKRQPEFAAYKEVERGIMVAVAKAFGVDPALLESDHVENADLVMLATEGRDLMRVPVNVGPDEAWGWRKPRRERIRPWSPGEAKARFLERYSHLVLRSSTDNGWGPEGRTP